MTSPNPQPEPLDPSLVALHNAIIDAETAGLPEFTKSLRAMLARQLAEQGHRAPESPEPENRLETAKESPK